MDSYLIYINVGILVALIVGIETWLIVRKLNEYDHTRDDVILRGVTNAILYGTFWPSVVILFVIGKMMLKMARTPIDK